MIFFFNGYRKFRPFYNDTCISYFCLLSHDSKYNTPDKYCKVCNICTVVQLFNSQILQHCFLNLHTVSKIKLYLKHMKDAIMLTRWEMPYCILLLRFTVISLYLFFISNANYHSSPFPVIPFHIVIIVQGFLWQIFLWKSTGKLSRKWTSPSDFSVFSKGKVQLKPLLTPLVKIFELRPISSQIFVCLLSVIIPTQVWKSTHSYIPKGCNL